MHALEAGNPRRFRAIVRILRRGGSTASLELHDAIGLFWEGAFEKAIGKLDRLMAGGELGELEPLAVAVMVECLLFADRPDEARKVYDLHAAELASLSSRGHATAGAGALEAMLAFHQGDRAASRRGLEAALRENRDEKEPSRRLLLLYLAAIAHQDGDHASARAHLAATCLDGGDLFVAKLAVDTHAEIFPGAPALPRTSSARRTSPRRAVTDLRRTFRRGRGILFFRKAAFDPGSFTHEKTVLLVLINLIIVADLRLVDYSPGATFLSSGATGLAAPILFFLVTAYLAARIAGVRNGAMALAGGFYSALPALLLLEGLGHALYDGRYHLLARGLTMVAGVWSAAIFLFLLRQLAPSAGILRTAGACAILAFTWIWPMQAATRNPVWIRFAPESEDSEREADEFLFDQVQKVIAAEVNLQAERAGISDLYFVGFASWDDQDVFLREATFAQRLFDRRFDTSGRSILLANDPSVRETSPGATKMNLRHVLGAVGARMNREEDILFLFLTSHGSKDGLSIQCRLGSESVRDDLSPRQLGAFLDEAGIKWRVLLISGCYTGVFVGPLANDFTLIATASAADRTSFGCAHGNDFTDFGRAVLDEQLTHERSFVTAFSRATERIGERERAQDRKPSRPQIFIGAAVVDKLHRLEARLAQLPD